MKNNIKHLNLTVIIVATILFTGCNSNNTNETGNYQASLRLGWIPSASFSGEIAGMYNFDEKYGLDLECEPGGQGMNSIQMVQNGEDTFGTLAADEVLAAIDKGADLVIIGVINYNSPGAFVSRKGSGIIKPEDFINKTVGLLPFGSTTLLYENMLEKNDIDKNKVTEIIISPDLKLFISGKYDVHPVFVYDETVTLDNQGVEYNLIEPKDFGVKFIGPVYFCKRKIYEETPEIVSAFVKTMADGWNFAINNPDSAIVLLEKFAPEINPEREIKVLDKAIPYYTAYNNQPINCDIQSWEEMIKDLREMNVIKNPIDLKKILYFEDINEYYNSDRP